MRVLMVSKLWPPRVAGGAERYAAGLADQLVSRGHEVGVVTYGVEGPRVIATVPTHGVIPDRWWEGSRWKLRASHIIDLWNPEARRILQRAVRSFRPDVVHSMAVAGMSVAALLTTPVPRVHHVNDHWLVCWRGYPMRNGQMCESICGQCVPFATSRRLLVQRRPPLLIAPSESVRRAHIDKGWDESGWRLIRYPVFPPDTPRPPRPAPTPPLRLGFIGQVNEYKGVDLLLAALDQLDDGTSVVVAGDGDLVDKVAAHPRVEHRGVVSGEAKEHFFDDIDVLVIPSRMEEVAGLVIDEAASRGVPVIGSRRGGIPEYVPPTCVPLLFEPTDPANLVASIRRFAADPARYPAVLPTGRSWTDNTDLVLAAYADAIADQSA